MDLWVYGSRNYAQTVAEHARDMGWQVLGFLDDDPRAPGIVGSFDAVSASDARGRAALVVGIGYKDLGARWQAWQRVLGAGWKTPALIHPHAYVARTAQVGAGSLVMAGAVVDHRARVGDVSVVWPGACVNHDVVIGDNCFISPGATLCGAAVVGAHSFIGAGAVLVDGAAVPEKSFVKMGATYRSRG